MRTQGISVAAVLLVLAVSPGHGQSLDFKFIAGKWVSVTPGASLGEPVFFMPAFEGFDAFVPFFPGQSFMGRVTDGHAAAHVKITSRDGQSCWYYVGIISSKEMTWALRDATSPNCPASALLRRESP
jgi:hypothetical protein